MRAAHLIERHPEAWHAATHHPFLDAVRDGTLPARAFAAWLTQDYLFVGDLLAAQARLLARAPRPDHGVLAGGLVADEAEPPRRARFFTLLSGALDELEMHDADAARWGVRGEEVRPHRATLTYTDFLLATAALRPVGETCAALTPCMRLYAYLGQALAARGEDVAAPYRAWIETYAHPAFAALAARLESLLDRYVTDSEAARVAYRRAMTLELDFFTAHDYSMNQRACMTGIT